ncbi:hypothetical protein EYR36_009192 [Pleurotus pulmonarius]|nr:hypothetical protein EYR36_009192 [Pleurotus pulmonarius]KAF4592688.1 hypothetical protein EYR38_008387 [Pleurotus pulmonarius]
MATEKITVSNAQTLLPSGQPMTGPTYILPGTDEEDASSPFSPESTGPLNPVIAEFNIADDPNAPTTVVKYEYDHSEDCDVDFDSDPDGEEETAPVLAEQRSRKNKGDGSLTAGTHFRVRDAAAMSKYAMGASASTPRVTLAEGRKDLREFDDGESKEVLCAAANIHWGGLPTSLRDPVFGTLGLAERMQVLRYLGLDDLMKELMEDEENRVFDNSDEFDAGDRTVESEDESSAGDRTTSTEQEIEVVDDRFLPDEEELECKDGEGDIPHGIPTDPAKIPLPESESDDDETSGFDKTQRHEQVDDEDNDSDDSDSDESESGDELFWSSPINAPLEVDEGEAPEQDAKGEDETYESGIGSDSSTSPNPLKRPRSPGPSDEEDEPPHKLARLEEDDLLSIFGGSALKLAIYNTVQSNMASKLETNAYWHGVLFD